MCFGESLKLLQRVAYHKCFRVKLLVELLRLSQAIQLIAQFANLAKHLLNLAPRKHPLIHQSPIVKAFSEFSGSGGWERKLGGLSEKLGNTLESQSDTVWIQMPSFTIVPEHISCTLNSITKLMNIPNNCLADSPSWSLFASNNNHKRN